MNGLDTNVLVRYLLQDDPKQSHAATRFIEQQCSTEKHAFINHMVLCGLVWVLESAYEYPKKDIAVVLEKILSTRQFCIHQPEVVWPALQGYKKEGADFADHLIAHLNAHNGCDVTVTFDKKAARLKYFQTLTVRQ